METRTLIELLMTLFAVLIFGLVAWLNRALSAGQIGRNSPIGIRTKAVTHCDKCWLLGHHAASAKINMALVRGVIVTVIPVVLGFFLQMPTMIIAAVPIIGLAIVGTGVFLGARDAAWVISKIHVSSPNS